MKKIWQMLTKPSSKYSILALVLVGIGIAVSGIFAVHKGFEHASTNEFCIGCHTMKQNYEESAAGKHISTRSPSAVMTRPRPSSGWDPLVHR